MLVLVAPMWPKQPWYPHLLDLLVDYPIRLPPRANLLRQPRTNIFHSDPERMALHAWKLSSNVCLQRAFRGRLYDAWLEPKRNPPWISTTQSGNVMYAGVTEGMLIPGRRLYQ